MPELDDDKTDKLFQVGADRHNFEYNPAAWEQMEGLLDADEIAQQRNRKLLAGGGTLLLLVLLSLLWFNLEPAVISQDGEASAPLAETGVLVPAQPAAKVRATNPASADEEASESELASSAALVSTAPLTSRNLKIVAESTGSLTGSANNTEGTNITEFRQQRPASQFNDGGGSGEQSPNGLTAPVALNTAGTENNADDALAARESVLAIDQIGRESLEALEYSRQQPAVTVSVAEEVPTFSAATPKPGIAVGVSLGAVSGMVSLDNPGPVDLRVGATVDYRFSNKLSVGTGGYLSRVCYLVDGKDYKASESFFEVIPKEVVADCDILEIPLNLTWHPAGSNQSGVYFGAGVSSLFMLTERFTFNYDVPADDLVKSWREDNTNQHIFGTGQLKFGYQRKAGQRSAFQVESFVQLPLTGLGHGKVNFFTVGASVNYTIDFRK